MKVHPQNTKAIIQRYRIRKNLLVFALLAAAAINVHAQFSVKYDPAVQQTINMQYFRPVGTNLFVGDCIPFFHDDTYYLYWLIDSAHHSALNGLGGHQWVVSTTKDLKHWTNYPVVLGIDEAWEKSICTGSVTYKDKKFYAFYATRLVNGAGKVNEQLSYAISDDGIHFRKQKPNPFYTSAPGYSKRDFRDPKVVVDPAGIFHLFVSSKKDNAGLKGFEGCLVHLTSKDLKSWSVNEPVLTGQGSVPECPDYFYWGGWYYLVYSDNSNTFYVKSRAPYGPWEEPPSQALNEEWANVVKTAEFVNGRRIAAAWVPSRRDNNDNNGEIFGGNAVFREVIQLEDGTLATKFPAELIPETGQPLPLTLLADSLTAKKDNSNFFITSPNGLGAAHFANLPVNCRISLEIEPMGNYENYGLYLRASATGKAGYRLNFSGNEGTVSLGDTKITAVDGLKNTIGVDIIMKDDIIDVGIDNRRCIVNRAIDQKGDVLWFYAKHGKVLFKSIKVFPLVEINFNPDK